MTVNTSNTTKNTPFAANIATQIISFSQSELTMYHHQSLGNPRKATLLRALKKYPTKFETFPGLTYELIRDYLLPSEAIKRAT